MKRKYRTATLSSFLLLLVFLAVSIFVYTSNDDSELNTKIVYTCPMHPEVISDKPGDCPDCGMFLVKKTNNIAGKQYTCPMHPKVVSDKPGDCPECGMFLVESGNDETNIDASAEPVARKTKKSKRNKTSEAGKQYVCSMHPQVIRNEPGDCPICGMFLIVLVDQDMNKYDSSLTDLVLSVNKSVFASVRSIKPERREIPLIIDATGILTYDPRSVRTISAAFEGTIEKSFVKYRYQFIKKGQKIYQIYSPYIYNDRWQYVLLIQTYPDRDDLTAEALSWFRLLGLSQGQIDSLKRARKPDYHLNVYSPAEGYVVGVDFDPGNFLPDDEGREGSGIGLRDGITVAAGDPLFKVIDVRSLQADLKIKTQNAPLLRKGQKVIITDAINPEIRYDAFIDQVEPMNNNLFQSVRIYLKDTNRKLSPGRQIKASIITGNREILCLPSSAVIDLGQRHVAFVLSDGRYVATEIRTGARTEDKVEILAGIDEHTIVAEKALLLLDSDGFITLN